MNSLSGMTVCYTAVHHCLCCCGDCWIILIGHRESSGYHLLHDSKYMAWSYISTLRARYQEESLRVKKCRYPTLSVCKTEPHTFNDVIDIVSNITQLDTDQSESNSNDPNVGQSATAAEVGQCTTI